LGTSWQGRSSEEKWDICSFGIAANTFPGTEFKVTEKGNFFQNLLCTTFDDDDDDGDGDVSNELNLWSRVPFLKLTVPQPVKKFPTF
jgi:hypothetical protein